MDLLESLSGSIYLDYYQELKKMKKLVIGCASILLIGCSHPASNISVSSAEDNISAIQGNLSAVDGKAVIVEQWLKTHK